MRPKARMRILDEVVEVEPDSEGWWPWERGAWPCENCWESRATALFRPLAGQRAPARFLCKVCLIDAVREVIA